MTSYGYLHLISVCGLQQGRWGRPLSPEERRTREQSNCLKWIGEAGLSIFFHRRQTERIGSGEGQILLWPELGRFPSNSHPLRKGHHPDFNMHTHMHTIPIVLEKAAVSGHKGSPRVRERSWIWALSPKQVSEQWNALPLLFLLSCTEQRAAPGSSSREPVQSYLVICACWGYECVCIQLP